MGPHHSQRSSVFRAVFLSVAVARSLGLSVPRVVHRRVALLSGGCAALGLPLSVRGEEAPRATHQVSLELKVTGETAPLRLDMEIYGEAAPASVSQFLLLAEGRLRAECVDRKEELLARNELKSVNSERACLDSLGEGVTLEDSSLWRLVPNYRLDFGRVASRFASRAPPAVEAETNSLKPSSRGSVSVKRGGEAFEFTITPADNPALDNEDLLVIGQVSSASLPTIDFLNSIPSKKSPFKPEPLGKNFARACEYSNPDLSCAANKPLRKILVARSSVTTL